MRSLALTVLLSGCVQPQPDSGARYTLTHYLAEIRLEDRPMRYDKRDSLPASDYFAKLDTEAQLAAALEPLAKLYENDPQFVRDNLGGHRVIGTALGPITFEDVKRAHRVLKRVKREATK